jgi:hypothetical protein
MTENHNINLMVEDQDDLLAGLFNVEAIKRKYSGNVRIAKKPGVDLDLAGWDVVRSDTTHYTGEKGEAPDGTRHYTVAILSRGEDVMYINTSDDGSPLEDPDELRHSDFVTIKIASDQGPAAIQATLAELVEGKIHVHKPVPENPNLVNIGFWSWSQMGPRLSRRKMLATPWEEVQQNYSATVGDALTDLGKIDPNNIPGKMVLLHGPPGTGKTNFLKTLALEWKSWCDLEIIVDPEVLFNNSDYLIQMLSERRQSDRWTILLMEDCDELIRKEAKAISGQALSRLLNATDGFLGYGHKLLVGLTTNEDLKNLHEAVLRSGRCLANIKVPPLTQAEATAWLDDPDLSAGLKGDTTLADLYALQSATGVITQKAPEAAAATGNYL